MQVRTISPAQRRGMVMLGVSAVICLALIALLAVRLVTAGGQVGKVSTFTLDGKSAPDFTTQLYNGGSQQSIHLAALKGHPVVINFFASWCNPCAEEAPVLSAGYQKYSAQGVVFIGLVYQDSKQNALDFEQQYGATYPVGADTGGDVAISYGVTGVPETVFINPQGVVVSKYGGALDTGTLDRSIAAIMR